MPGYDDRNEFIYYKDTIPVTNQHYDGAWPAPTLTCDYCLQDWRRICNYKTETRSYSYSVKRQRAEEGSMQCYGSCYGTRQAPMPLRLYSLEYCLTILQLFFEYHLTIMVCNKKEEENGTEKPMMSFITVDDGKNRLANIYDNIIAEMDIMSTTEYLSTNRRKGLMER